jgi:orotidine-5'-phosphate decarboxylase
LLVIGDIKRGDISSTAEAYAAHLSGAKIEDEYIDVWHEDAITVNPYLGSDGATPFVDAAAENGKAIFVLIRTSNPGSGDIQELAVRGSRYEKWANACSRDAVAPAGNGIPLYVHVAGLVRDWGAEHVEKCGFGCVGAVVGATHKEQGAMLRKLLPNTFFLVPGYGAQGATADDLRGFFGKDGRGCVVNSSRGIIAAWQKGKRFSAGTMCDVTGAAREAALRMRDDLRSVL